MWTCPECGEQSEKNFAACWNCEAERPEGIDTDEEWKIPPLACPRCGASSQYLGVVEVLEDRRTLAALTLDFLDLGHSTELLERISLDIYLCPKCSFRFFIDNSVGEDLRPPS